MRIGLLSDTHIPNAALALPLEVMDAFNGVDLILHAGDIYDPAVLDDLERIAPVLVARGDDDGGFEMMNDKRVKEKHVLNFGNQTLWLVHCPSYWLMKDIKQATEGREHCGNDAPTVVVHGHLHQPTVRHSSDILFVCSGSPTLLDYRKGPGTVAVLTIERDKVDAQILWL